MPPIWQCVTVLAALTVAGCASATATGAGPEKPDITIASVPATGAAGLYIAQQDGLFARAGLHVTILLSISAADVVPELLRGQIDVLAGQWTTAIALQAKHIGLKALAAGNAGAPKLQMVMVPGNSPLKSPRQLKGKTIAVNVLGGLSELIVLADLTAYGVGPDGVRFAAIPFPEEAAALAAHRVDAAFMTEPFISQAETKDGDQELFDTSQGPTANLPITGYVATRAWAGKYPKTAAAFTKALDEGQQIADTNRGEVERVLRIYIHGLGGTASLIALGEYPISVNPVPLVRVGSLMQQFPGISGLPASVNVPQVIKELTR